MEKRTIEDIAYLIKQAEKNKENKPIVFLGAGASASAGIPLAGQIIKDILEKHSEKPSIKRLSEEEKDDYYKLMSALSAQERRNLFASYINNENVKLNVTHVYLAQLLREGYVDYILTVNFDDLMLKACALFNFIPPVYDVSVLNDFTTTNFLEKSITYLHGQHHGQWLLNASGELSKVSTSIPKIFERICHNRTWLVIGYSGEDELVNEIAKIGSFENELYWVGYKENPLSEKVRKKLFDKPRINAYHIKGYDSDSFFLKLHSELKLKTPQIFNKPFSFVQQMIGQVTDIKIDENSEHKSLYDIVKYRMEISKKQIEEAIKNIENRDDENEQIQKILEIGIKQEFSLEILDEIEKHIKKENYLEAKKVLSNVYNDWAFDISDSLQSKFMEDQFNLLSKLFEKAVELNPLDDRIYVNWGAILGTLGQSNNRKELVENSFEKYEKAIEINSNNDKALINWGIALNYLGILVNNEDLIYDGFNKYERALKISPNNSKVYFVWGNGLNKLAIAKNSESLFNESFQKFEEALKLDPKDSISCMNWGAGLINLGKIKQNKRYYDEGLEKYEIASQLDSENGLIFFNWGIELMNIGKIEKNDKLFLSSFDKFQIALKLKSSTKKEEILDCWTSSLLFYSNIISNESLRSKVILEALEKSKMVYEIDGNSYNLACAYALLNEKNQAYKYLDEMLAKNSIDVSLIERDSDWDNYRQDEDFVNLLNQYRL